MAPQQNLDLEMESPVRTVEVAENIHGLKIELEEAMIPK